MKLVTGIEAIQSGKRFRFVFIEPGSCATYSNWFGAFSEIPSQFKFSDLLHDKWQIEQEPREFWLRVDAHTKGHVAEVGYTNPDPNKKIVGIWIKVREVME